jgi:GIY-YIG catalytic domain-containing protein
MATRLDLNRVKRLRLTRWSSLIDGMFYVYLLHSIADHGFYIGYTMDLARRLAKHKHGASFATHPHFRTNSSTRTRQTRLFEFGISRDLRFICRADDVINATINTNNDAIRRISFPRIRRPKHREGV